MTEILSQKGYRAVIRVVLLTQPVCLLDPRAVLDPENSGKIPSIGRGPLSG